MQANKFLLYGANGYTGELIARYAAQFNLYPILAGRRREAIEPLAKKMNLSYAVFDLDDSAALLSALAEVKVVIHAAGPFHQTARQMIEACIRAGVHYLDINGDISVFEMIKQYAGKAKKAGIMLMPGAGFDVVPTDCLSLYLKNKLPDANSLQLAFASLGGGVSHGTAITITGKLGEGGAVRKKGAIKKTPLGRKGMWVEFGKYRLFTMNIPWGDISTAYSTTGIPDIEVYTGVPRSVFYLLKIQFLFNWLLRTGTVRNFIRKKIGNKPAGPSDEQRKKAKGLVWGRVKNHAGQSVSAHLSGPEGYTLTTYSSLIIAKKVLENNFLPGYQTPAGCYGADLILEVPGIERFDDQV